MILPRKPRIWHPVLPPMPFVQPLDTDPNTESKAKGEAFERFVVDRFNDEYFKVVDWRSDKCHNGRAPESNRFPDLKFRFEYGKLRKEFAVECKWRASFHEGEVRWSYPKQVENYLAYQQRERIAVFVAIAVGGSPKAPEHFFILRLDDLRNQPVRLSKDFLQRYSRHTEHNFYLDTEKMRLL